MEYKKGVELPEINVGKEIKSNPLVSCSLSYWGGRLWAKLLIPTENEGT